MENKNMEFEKIISRYKLSSQPFDVGDDFETRVFSKIKRKKTQRKVTLSVSIGIVAAGFLFGLQAFLFHQPPTLRDRSAQSITNPTRVESNAKEEVPVMEDVVFSSSDSRASYAIEQVGYTQKDTI